MGEHMSIEELTPDQIESELVRLESIVGRVRGVQVQLIDHANELALPRMDGARSLVDWVAARLDVTRETARDLARVARGGDVDHLAAGEVSFDRAVVRRRLIEVGACKEMITESDRFDLAGARRLVARHRRCTAVERRGRAAVRPGRRGPRERAAPAGAEARSRDKPGPRWPRPTRRTGSKAHQLGGPR